MAPMTAGPQGLSFVALRMRTGNSEPTYLQNPGAREKLQPSRRRNLTAGPVKFSVEPLMQSRKDPIWETVFEETDDGMAAHLVQTWRRQTARGPDPKLAGGYYVFVGNGSLVQGEEELPLWSMVVVEPNEDKFELRAGPERCGSAGAAVSA